METRRTKSHLVHLLGPDHPTLVALLPTHDQDAQLLFGRSRKAEVGLLYPLTV